MAGTSTAPIRARRQRPPVACPHDRRRRLPGRRRHRRARCVADRRRARHRGLRRARRARRPRHYHTHRALSPIPERHVPRRLRFPAARQRPPPPLPFLSLLSSVSSSPGPPHLPNPSPFHHQPSFLFGPRPRSRTLMVRGRGRGPNRPPTPVFIGVSRARRLDCQSGVQSIPPSGCRKGRTDATGASTGARRTELRRACVLLSLVVRSANQPGEDGVLPGTRRPGSDQDVD